MLGIETVKKRREARRNTTYDKVYRDYKLLVDAGTPHYKAVIMAGLRNGYTAYATSLKIIKSKENEELGK